jgi:hypothetical protein
MIRAVMFASILAASATNPEISKIEFAADSPPEGPRCELSASAAHDTFEIVLFS